MTDAKTEVSCTNCEKPTELPICDECASDRYKEEQYCEACDRGEGNSRENEIDDVLEFLRQLEIDVERCGRAPNLADIRMQLERGDHR